MTSSERSDTSNLAILLGGCVLVGPFLKIDLNSFWQWEVAIPGRVSARVKMAGIFSGCKTFD